ncbi:PIN family toxin-antitoxin system, toxin component [Streptomyces albus]|uniref:Ribonuclease VapC n=1 Tax=Streptomyces albus (strain ATCC 21838 / DSM 41398 / FERM P-419 / JCM 4703 / NBRC 107858) TaxID=1081613 RepID=A0A0B5EXZ9_STRA4|nr:PIN family toxin-antitoxin system, toxin component [Streptomyces albus]AOU77824.1 PIN family toxin-antitoxin system, toxin component [Streptomyces albus]AYN33584.1 PIN domain-containing protein [Streptomyces albus]
MTDVLIADTSGLYSFYVRSEPDHAACRKAVAEGAHLVISPLVLAELDYLLTTRIGPDAAQQALSHIRDATGLRRYAVPEVEAHLGKALSVMHRYPHIGLTDTMNVVLAAEYHTDAVLTLGRRHFRAIRPLTGHPAFRLLPDDL